MSETSSVILEPNIYDEELNKETTLNLSSSNLDYIPEIENKLLSALYLQNNRIINIPDDFFPSLPSLIYLDLRDNQITDIPKSIQNHQSLTHLLLQNNKLTTLPNELGTVNLKVLQLKGNPIMYPPRDVLNAGVSKILTFLYNKYADNMFAQSYIGSEDTMSSSVNFQENISQGVVSYNSVIDADKLKEKTLSVKLNEKDCEDSDDECYGKIKGKCPKLAKSRYKTLPSYYQSSKYVNPPYADSRDVQNQKIKQSYLKELTIKKHKELLARREKILQDRKNVELLRNWRKEYRIRQQSADGTYKLEPKNYPYDTNPEYMTLLTREDIEKDLPDKYRRRLIRKSKPTVPRKGNNDVHLAMKIKQLFANLEAIDLNREGMTPRTEQKALLTEIQKISEIKQKLMELSTSNSKSVTAD
ncbi:leucine-rich repeat-containing protein 27-like [Galleria mellonella]|uniref:Leucine-rich repeat-containing protein 27-like n=1 Tax=Galleria mellonella TaxID=7137 RepID=A0A6J1WR74_GALME|nr:leucine-rich repeat-containing protein 27-like [Galleria mellonella]